MRKVLLIGKSLTYLALTSKPIDNEVQTGENLEGGMKAPFKPIDYNFTYTESDPKDGRANRRAIRKQQRKKK